MAVTALVMVVVMGVVVGINENWPNKAVQTEPVMCSFQARSGLEFAAEWCDELSSRAFGRRSVLDAPLPSFPIAIHDVSPIHASRPRARRPLSLDAKTISKNVSMGLEIAEIIMEIEDEFCIQLPDCCLGIEKSRVKDLEDAVIGQGVPGAIRGLLDHLPQSDDNGFFSEPYYSEFWKKHKGLPSPNRFFGFKKVMVREIEVKNILNDRLAKYQSEIVTRIKIRALIRDRLSWPTEIQPEMDLIKDLHYD